MKNHFFAQEQHIKMILLFEQRLILIPNCQFFQNKNSFSALCLDMQRVSML